MVVSPLPFKSIWEYFNFLTLPLSSAISSTTTLHILFSCLLNSYVREIVPLVLIIIITIITTDNLFNCFFTNFEQKLITAVQPSPPSSSSFLYMMIYIYNFTEHVVQNYSITVFERYRTLEVLIIISITTTPTMIIVNNNINK